MLSRKRRTRAHIIADLSINHAERHVLLCGYTVERVWHDYGYDLLLTTYDTRGEVENGEIRIQVKATESLRHRQKGKFISCRIETADLRLWLKEKPPVILIVYDVLQEDAHWLYVQAYFERLPNFDLSHAGNTVTVSIPTTNKLSAGTVRQFALFRDAVSIQMEVTHRE